MKITKFISFILVAVMMVSFCCSCVTTDAEEIGITLKIVAGDDVIYNKEVKVSDTKDDSGNSQGCLVIDVVKEAMATLSSTTITLDSTESSIQAVNNYEKCTKDDKSFFWSFTIDGVEPEAGKANTNYAAAGSTIVYTFKYSVANDAGTSDTFDYDSELALFGENGDEEVEEDVDATAEAAE